MIQAMFVAFVEWDCTPSEGMRGSFLMIEDSFQVIPELVRKATSSYLSFNTYSIKCIADYGVQIQHLERAINHPAHMRSTTNDLPLVREPVVKSIRGRRLKR